MVRTECCKAKPPAVRGCAVHHKAATDMNHICATFPVSGAPLTAMGHIIVTTTLPSCLCSNDNLAQPASLSNRNLKLIRRAVCSYFSAKRNDSYWFHQPQGVPDPHLRHTNPLAINKPDKGKIVRNLEERYDGRLFAQVNGLNRPIQFVKKSFRKDRSTPMSWGDIKEDTDESVSPHHFSTLRPQEMAKWLRAVAKEYVRLRTECSVNLPAVLDVSGLGSFDVSQLNARLKKALVPQDDTQRKAFSVTRSDLSEVAAYMLLEQRFGTEIAYKLVRDRELVALPGRGIDAIGIEKGEKLFVVLGEVKFSDEASAPKAPQVVDKAKDGMRNQHLGHLEELSCTVDKIWDCARRARTPEERDSLMAAALYLEHQKWDNVGIVSCCVLVRPEQHHSPGDFGSFREQPSDFVPAAVRFLVWTLPGDMESILQDWVKEVEAQRHAA